MTIVNICDSFSVSGEISEQDFVALKELGVSTIINARPDNETDGQINDEEYQALCEAHGMDYVHVPVKPGNYSQDDIQSVADALSRANHKVHGFCKTGGRALHLWTVAQIEYKDFEELQAIAQSKGYDLGAVKKHFD